MSKLYLLRPLDDDSGAWVPWYDKCFGFVVRAPDEQTARALAAEEAGDEKPDVWLSSDETSCEILEYDGDIGVVIQDFHAA